MDIALFSIVEGTAETIEAFAAAHASLVSMIEQDRIVKRTGEPSATPNAQPTLNNCPVRIICPHPFLIMTIVPTKHPALQHNYVALDRIDSLSSGSSAYSYWKTGTAVTAWVIDTGVRPDHQVRFWRSGALLLEG